MAGETIIVVGTPKTLEANGASTANNAITAADDASYGIVADGASFPDAKFVLAFAYTTPPTENAEITLVARPLNIDSTNDTDVPEATFIPYWIGSFLVNNVGSSTVQYSELVAYDVPWEASYYILNNATGQTINAGWTLKVTPFSRKAA